ncbi:unnamed protein product, partial [Mesorhabditis spiculigera]
MNGAGHEGSERPPERRRGARPDVQIYRPGMMRRGIDITLQNIPESPQQARKLTSPRNSRENGFRVYENSTRRRPSEESQNSGSTTPDYRKEAPRRSPRGGMSRQGEPRRGPGGSEYSSREDLDSRASYGYNSTQSLLDPRPKPGGYLDQNQRGRGKPQREERQLYRPSRQAFERTPDRSSMRAERGNRLGARPGRNRNDSINSTQSERPASLFVDTTERYDDSRSLGYAASEAPSSQQSLSFAELCASFDSMSSMNWSEIVEDDYNNPDPQSFDARELKARLHQEQSENGARRSFDTESDRGSSVADSITEENGESCEENERTPTRSRSPELAEKEENEKSKKKSDGRIALMNIGQPVAKPRAEKAESIAETPASSEPVEDLVECKHSQGGLSEEAEERFEQRVKKLNGELENLVPSISARDFLAADKAIEISQEISENYMEILPLDVEYSFSNNLENRLWKNAYHRLIEALRSGSNSTKDGARKLLTSLKSLISNGLVFYKRLIMRYEEQFGIPVDQLLYWPGGFPEVELENVYLGQLPLDCLSDIQKVAAKSLSRHFLACGNLHRYFAITTGSDDFSQAKGCYLRAVQLWPEGGTAYSQLAILAYNTMLYGSRVRARLTPLDRLSDQRQANVIDETFFFVRALACGRPYWNAKERMNQRLTAMLGKIEKYEPLLNKEFGKSKNGHEINPNENCSKEIWIRKDGKLEPRRQEESHQEVEAVYLQKSGSTLHRRLVSYFVGAIAMIQLRTNMHKFKSVATRSLSYLSASLRAPDCKLSALQLAQLTAICIYAAETATKSISESAVRYLISLLGVLLKSEDQALVWPSIHLICIWLSSDGSQKILESTLKLKPMKLKAFPVDTWDLLSKSANAAQEDQAFDPKETGYLPELLLLSSFGKSFPNPPQEFELEDANASKIRRWSVVEASLACSRLPQAPIVIEEETQKFLPNLSFSIVSPSLADTVDNENGTHTEATIYVDPAAIVPDTSSFIDHFNDVVRLSKLDNLKLYVSSAVREDLQKIVRAPKGRDQDEHGLFIQAQARSVVQWIEQSASEKEGNVGFLEAAASSQIDLEDTDFDDALIKSCLELSNQFSTNRTKVPGIPDDANVKRVILLTDDRSTHYKASIQGLPTKTLPSFLHWCN